MKTVLGNYTSVYFLGIVGIGMSALARYFNLSGITVSGYDKTPSPLTETLEKEGIDIHFDDQGTDVLKRVGTPENTLIVYTPAIPKDHKEWNVLKENNFKIIKRAEVLGMITRFSKGLAVAGTHGKTTTSTLLAHLLHETVGCNAFLGGISSNYNTNYLSSESSPFTVIEADEFDRSFLQLSPFASIITSADPDHLDIYGDAETFRLGFEDYAKKIDKDGFLIVRKGIELQTPAKTFTYAVGNSEADFNGHNLRYENGRFLIDVTLPYEVMTDVELGLPGWHNAENAVGCIALCYQLNLDLETIREGLKTFKGVKRRFEYHFKSQNLIYIDDYAHHPTELKALLGSVSLLYPDKKKIGVFQPHLFTRTRDFMDEFAEQLSRLDELILLPIYPARELPIAGITSEALLAKVTLTNKKVLSKEETIAYLKNVKAGVVLTIGAGDIDRLVPEIAQNFKQ